MVTISNGSDWSWSSVSTSRALAETEELTSREIGSTRINDESGQYRMLWQHYEMGPVGLNFLTVSPQRVIRNQSMIERDRNRDFHIMLLRSGVAHAQQGGKSCDLPAGTMYLLDCAQPWDILFPADHYCLTAHIDYRWLQHWLPEPSILAGRAVDASGSWVLPLVSMMNAIAADGLDNAPLPRALLADQMAGLLVLALGPHEHMQRRHETELVKRIRAIIRDRYDRRDLTAKQVADDLGISRRYLDKILADARTTFLTLLEAQRLEAARLKLVDHRSMTQIAEIAWSCGFADPGYFARRFARRYGMSPSSFRQAATDKRMQ
ncbi:helix-turn-helix domain-containing protein [Sphingobium sp. CCH11-B1]|uniref:helix-turn-helix domain-containing protein n=1 Tax=Sphingobium sp. CCH11-B1 TaxID=1768781 RepID=UPI00082CF9F8|nr:helix-turn-helix domain-containing protein [Sphingobium sp. CCH11-B1]